MTYNIISRQNSRINQTENMNFLSNFLLNFMHKSNKGLRLKNKLSSKFSLSTPTANSSTVSYQ
jgi:hypothetical protein